MLYRSKKKKKQQEAILAQEALKKMAGEDTELCGFLDGKLPFGHRSVQQRVKKRSLAPWKVWRRHWCAVRKLGPGQGLEILLDHGVGSQAAVDKDSCIRIPADSFVCRTESRTKHYAFGIFPAKERKPLIYLASTSEIETQKWMASLRQLLRPRRHRLMEGAHEVSMVDNAHSRSAGLTGLYGDLIASKSGVFIKDVHTGVVETFEWNQMDAIHLACTGTTEDVKQICVVHTTKNFRGGIGELHFFCPNASSLLKDLVTQGRGPKQSRHHQLSQQPRPLSLSEGDLRTAAKKELVECPEQDGMYTLKQKVAMNLIHAGLGLLLSARSGSEAKLLGSTTNGHGLLEKLKNHKVTTHRRAVDNVYQAEPANLSNATTSLEELEELSLRRVSGISVASGIYEEIRDDHVPTKARRVPSHLYENPGDLMLNSNFKFQPPPLPPRQRSSSGSTRNESTSDDGFDSEGGTRSASPSTQEDSTPTPEDKTSETCMTLDTSEYVPMSPRLRDIALLELQQQTQQENMYMVMR